MRVFVSAPFGVPLGPLLSVLRELGVTVVTPSEIGAGEEWSMPWNDIDGVIAIVGKSERSGTVLVEAGVALGRGLPLLVLADKQATTPLPFTQAVRLQALDNREALRLHVGFFVEGLGKTREESKVAPAVSLPVDVAEARARLKEIRGLDNNIRGQAFEEMVLQLFQHADAIVAIASDADRGFDFVADVPGVEQSLGPILVEVKSWVDTEHLAASLHRLQTVAIQQRAGFGLIVFDQNLSDVSPAAWVVPLVFAISIDELLGRLQRQSLARVLAGARNESVHAL